MSMLAFVSDYNGNLSFDEIIFRVLMETYDMDEYVIAPYEVACLYLYGVDARFIKNGQTIPSVN